MTKSVYKYSNNARTTLQSGITSSNTTLFVVSTAAFPSLGTSENFKVTLDDGVGTPEIVSVQGVVSGQLINCLRGQEGTTARSFASGSRVEMRLTAGQISEMLRKQDRLFEIASIESLSSPLTNDSNSYIASSTDPDGGLIVVLRVNDSKWRLINYPHLIQSGATPAGATSGGMSLTGATALLPDFASKVYVIQWTSGAHSGRLRFLTSITSGSIAWATPLPSSPSPGDTYELFRYSKFAQRMPTGGNSDTVFYENSNTITSNYTVTSGKNALSAGPITINTGVTVTVTSPSAWSIV